LQEIAHRSTYSNPLPEELFTTIADFIGDRCPSTLSQLANQFTSYAVACGCQEYTFKVIAEAEINDQMLFQCQNQISLKLRLNRREQLCDVGGSRTRQYLIDGQFGMELLELVAI